MLEICTEFIATARQADHTIGQVALVHGGDFNCRADEVCGGSCMVNDVVCGVCDICCERLRKLDLLYMLSGMFIARTVLREIGGTCCRDYVNS